MARGGKRKGTGRPKASSEPTKTVRVPISFAEKIPELLQQYQEENSFDDLQLPSKRDENLLPLASLAWDAFESFSLDFIARFLKPKDIYHYGTQGDNQEGVDIVADLQNGEKWAFQCKQWQKFNKSDAIKVIQQAQGFEANRLILLLSRIASVEVRKVIADDPRWELWDVRDISQKVQEIEIESARRLVRGHFHPEWQNAFLKISKLTPFISYEDFFHGWLNENRLFNHTWKLEGRGVELKSLHGFVSLQDKQVAILSGRGGIGKTRLLYEFAKTFEHSNFLLWFVEEGQSVTPENVDNLSLHPCIIVLDDAHKLERERDLQTLLAIIRERARNHQPEIKLLLSSRPYAIDRLKLTLRQGGVSSSQVEIIKELKDLKMSESKALSLQALGNDYAHFAELLAKVTKDCPLVTVVGGRLLATKGIPLYLLERDEDFQYEVLNQFENDLVKSISNNIEPKISKKILELIAAISPIHLMEEQFQEAASEFLNIDRAELLSYIGTLENGGILLRRGDGLRITPDVLSDHILHKACLTDQGETTGYAKQVFDRFRQICPSQLLSNLAELDWRIQSKTGLRSDLMNDIWQQIRNEFQSESHFGRWQLLGILENSAYNQPEQTLDLVKFAIRNPAKSIEKEFSSSLDTHEAVVKKSAKLLHIIGYTIDYLPECCDILWKLAKDNKEILSLDAEHPLKILIKLAQYDLYKPLQFHQIVLNRAAYWLKKAKFFDEVNSLLDIVEQFLDRDFDANYIEGRTAYFQKVLVSREVTENIRSQSLELITSSLNSDDIKIVLRTLEVLKKVLGNTTKQSPEDFSKEWGSEQVRTIEIIDQFIHHNKNWLICIEVIEMLRHSTYHGCIASVKEKAQAVINSIKDTYEVKLAMVLLHKYDWTDPKYSELFKEMPKIVAKEFLQRYPNATDGVKVLNGKLEEIRECNFPPFQVYSYDLLEAIAESDVDYAASMCEILIQNPDWLLSSQLTPLLARVKLDNPDFAIKLTQQALEKEDFCLSSAVARTYLCRGWTKQIRDDDLDFIKILLNHLDFRIRAIAIMSLKELSLVQPHTAVSFALAVNLEDNPTLASELCQLFTMRDSINPDILTENHWKILLNKIESITHIDDHWIQEFLDYASKKVPILVIQMLLKRIENYIENPNRKYNPLPYDNLKYTFNFSECSTSKEAIQIVRDLSLRQSQHISFLLSKLFKAVLKNATDLSLSVLNEWVNSDESEKIESVSHLLGSIPQSFALTQVEFLSNLLEKAYDSGYQCFEVVNRNLFYAVTSGGHGGTLGEPSEKDVTLRDHSSAIASQFLIGSPAHKFYSSLAKYADSNIKRQIDLGRSEID
ncbi:restriction endonuclease [Microcystis sp. M158S2]|uniref:restriction endonuclease n=1 Tax=Microcystis sp. M158S2 TaxID=2771152 RepID=UPI002583015B|nr:restriction endonuclease [Microcystis sp. M158S2]MCA2736674.1 restriction endonuclease [Microcystis sp. M158S2]